MGGGDGFRAALKRKATGESVSLMQNHPAFYFASLLSSQPAGYYGSDVLATECRMPRPADIRWARPG